MLSPIYHIIYFSLWSTVIKCRVQCGVSSVFWSALSITLQKTLCRSHDFDMSKKCGFTCFGVPLKLPFPWGNINLSIIRNSAGSCSDIWHLLRTSGSQSKPLLDQDPSVMACQFPFTIIIFRIYIISLQFNSCNELARIIHILVSDPSFFTQSCH